MDAVMMNAPPSGLALKVLSASRNVCMWPLTLTAQHYTCDRIREDWFSTDSMTYLIPVILIQRIEVAEGGKFRPALESPHQLDSISRVGHVTHSV